MDAFIDAGDPLPRGSVAAASRAPLRQRPGIGADLSHRGRARAFSLGRRPHDRPRRRIRIFLGGASERRPNAFSLHPDIAASADPLRRYRVRA
jgi:hypothetical protein